MTKVKNLKESELVKDCLINNLIAVQKLLVKCKNDKDLKKSETTLSAIRISRTLDKITKEFYEEQKEIFEKFEVPLALNDEGAQYYNTSSLEKSLQDKVFEALNIHASKNYEVKCFNTIDADEFVIYVKGLEHVEKTFLYEYLVKDIED